jgi:Sporulation and spore germination/Immunoglobulin-like domain of bacterial spore germination
MTAPRPEDVLRQAFEAQAEQVQVSPDALQVIRSRVSRRRRTLAMSLASLATAATASVAAVVVGLGSCLPVDTARPIPPGGPGSAPASTAATQPVSVRLPVYYIGVVRSSPVLYREFHTHSLPEESLPLRIRAAVGDMLSVAPFDPDYSSSWPAGSAVRDVTLDGEIAVVDLSGAQANTVDKQSAQMAVQQLVWTVTGVAADRGVQLRGVRLLLDGHPVGTLWGQVPTGGDLTRAAALNTLARVWLISPQEGDTVPGTFDAHIGGAVYEATAQLRARDAGGSVVWEKVVTLSIGAPQRGEAHVSVTLPPGRYTLETFTISATDGSEQAHDNHTITVR